MRFKALRQTLESTRDQLRLSNDQLRVAKLELDQLRVVAIMLHGIPALFMKTIWALCAHLATYSGASLFRSLAVD